MRTPSLFFILLFFSVFCFGSEVPERPKPPKLVNDMEGLLSSQEQEKLENSLNAYFDSTNTEIVILIQKTIHNDDIVLHSQMVLEKWGIGGLNSENGAIIAFAHEDNHIGVILGSGISNFVDDHSTYRIRENLLKPNFRKGDYYEGLDQATHALMNLISGHYEVHDVKTENQNAYISIIIILSVFFIFFILLPAWRYRAVKKSHMGGHMDLVSIFLLMNNLGGSGGRSFGDFREGKGNFRHHLQISGHNQGGGGSQGQW